MHLDLAARVLLLGDHRMSQVKSAVASYAAKTDLIMHIVLVLYIHKANNNRVDIMDFILISGPY